MLCSVVARDAEGAPVYVKRYLEGYRLYINGKLHMRLDNSAQSLSLTKCKPGKSYDVSLVALTSTEAARREKKRVSIFSHDCECVVDCLLMITVGREDNSCSELILNSSTCI